VSTPSTTAAGPVQPDQLRLGQAVHVNAHATWLPATVTSIAHTSVGVAYDAEFPHPFAGRVAPWVVRPADGIRLQHVHALRAGDEVVAFDGAIHTIAHVWQGRDRWWVIDYTSGEHAVVPPQAILRLTDPHPPASVTLL
jgi:hypothetical protein